MDNRHQREHVSETRSLHFRGRRRREPSQSADDSRARQTGNPTHRGGIRSVRTYARSSQKDFSCRLGVLFARQHQNTFSLEAIRFRFWQLPHLLDGTGDFRETRFFFFPFRCYRRSTQRIGHVDDDGVVDVTSWFSPLSRPGPRDVSGGTTWESFGISATPAVV